MRCEAQQTMKAAQKHDKQQVKCTFLYNKSHKERFCLLKQVQLSQRKKKQATQMTHNSGI